MGGESAEARAVRCGIGEKDDMGMGEPDLEDLVLSWSVQQLIDGGLYGGKVETIPSQFKSLDHYLTSYVPLIEETRSDLCSCLELISEAPSSKILSMDVVAGKPGSYLMDVDFWDKDACFLNEAYSVRNGDVFILSSIKPEAADDLNRHGVTYCLAMATKVSMDDEYHKGFRVKVAKNIGLEEDLNKLKHAVFLNNITTNIRIWKALTFDEHMNDNFTVIKSLLAPTNLEQEEGVEEVKQRGGDIDGVDQRDKKPSPIFVQDAWSSALSEAEARVHGYSQNCIEDIPCFQIDLSDISEKSYRKLMNQIDRRMKKVSSLLLSGTPTTPPRIPGVELFHIVEIIDAKDEHIEAIQCLFRESSLYFGAFRALGLDPGWFIFDDEPVPQWVKGTKIPYSVAHGNISQKIPHSSEGSYKTLKPGITAEVEAEDDIHNWANQSREGFDFKLNKCIQLPPTSKGNHAEILRKKAMLKSELIGPRGELLLLKYDEDYVIPIIIKRQEKAARKAAHWKPEEDVLNKICKIFQEQLDNQFNRALTKRIRQLRKLQDFHKYLIYILIHKEGLSIQERLAAGLLLKNNLEVPSGYGKISPSCLHYMKSELSRCVGTCYKAIRSTVTTIIAALFRWVRVAGWMDLFQELYEYICSADPDRNEAALEVFCKISENDAQHLNVDIIGLPERPIGVFMPVFLQFLRSPDATFRKLALGCVRQYMVMPNTPSLHRYMDEYLQHLLDLFKDPSLDVRKQVCLAWIQLAEHLPSTLEKKLAKMDDEGWNDSESAFSSSGAIAEVFALLILPIDKEFPLIRSTIRHIIVLCSKFTIQGLDHANGREQFVHVLVALLRKTLDANEKVQELAICALDALEEEMEIRKGAEDEAILACQYYIQEHGAEGWEKLMSILDPAIVRRLQRYEV